MLGFTYGQDMQDIKMYYNNFDTRKFVSRVNMHIILYSSIYIYIYIYIKNFAWEDQSEKVFYKCHIYASVLYCVVIEHLG